jgi:hypothetical protein
MKLLRIIYTEQYCCVAGYLELCKARGETVKGMAETAGITADAIWYHLRNLKCGKTTCLGRSDCLRPIIEEIKKSP